MLLSPLQKAKRKRKVLVVAISPLKSLTKPAEFSKHSQALLVTSLSSSKSPFHYK